MPAAKEKESKFKVERKSFHGACEGEFEKWLADMDAAGWKLVTSSQDGAASLFVFSR